jgi:benzoyl-CoA reductase/2-hydroxyglutaryl-CoA dehydratase subunit BcrC/BadD/HgdB
MLKAEVEERVANGVAAVDGERYRLYWEGPAIWCALRPLSELFLSEGVAVVASSYCSSFAFEGFAPENPIASMARAYTSVFHNRSDEHKMKILTSRFREFGVDGVVYHEGRTAPEHSNVRYGLEVRLRRVTGLPSIVLEADTHDLRLFSMDDVERNLRDFIELQESLAERPPGAHAVFPGNARNGVVHG